MRIGPYLVPRRNLAGLAAGALLVLAGLALGAFPHGFDGECRYDNPRGCTVADLDSLQDAVDQHFRDRMMDIREQVRRNLISPDQFEAQRAKLNDVHEEQRAKLRQSRRAVASLPDE